MRLSWKAGQHVSKLVGYIEERIRLKAATRAHSQGREFANEQDVDWAYKQVIASCASDFLVPPKPELIDSD